VRREGVKKKETGWRRFRGEVCDFFVPMTPAVLGVWEKAKKAVGVKRGRGGEEDLHDGQGSQEGETTVGFN